jgi:hypothetical protein
LGHRGWIVAALGHTETVGWVMPHGVCGEVEGLDDVDVWDSAGDPLGHGWYCEREVLLVDRVRAVDQDPARRDVEPSDRINSNLRRQRKQQHVAEGRCLLQGPGSSADARRHLARSAEVAATDHHLVFSSPLPGQRFGHQSVAQCSYSHAADARRFVTHLLVRNERGTMGR